MDEGIKNNLKIMKITICGSMSAAKKIMEVENRLKENGDEIILPESVELYAEGKLSARDDEPAHKIANDLIRDHYNKIVSSDAILVVNENKNGIENYVGGNTFLEIGFAYILRKPIYLLNPIPEVSYKDEIIAMQPIILNGDFNEIN